LRSLALQLREHVYIPHLEREVEEETGDEWQPIFKSEAVNISFQPHMLSKRDVTKKMDLL